MGQGPAQVVGQVSYFISFIRFKRGKSYLLMSVLGKSPLLGDKENVQVWSALYFPSR